MVGEWSKHGRSGVRRATVSCNFSHVDRVIDSFVSPATPKFGDRSQEERQLIADSRLKQLCETYCAVELRRMGLTGEQEQLQFVRRCAEAYFP